MIFISFRSVLSAAFLAIWCTSAATAQSCPADLNDDDSVNGADLAVVLAAWGPCTTGSDCPADLNDDMEVNASDLAALLAAWGPCRTPTSFLGTVIRDNGSAVTGATVFSQFGSSASTDAYGYFQLDAAVPPDATTVIITASTLINDISYEGSREIEGVSAGGIYDLDPIVLAPTGDCGDDAEWLPQFSSVWRSNGAGRVNGFAQFDDGSGPKVFAGGSFIYPGNGQTSTRIASWDGTAWSSGPTNGWVNALAVFDDGAGPALYAGGAIASTGLPLLAKWDGTEWSNVGPSGVASVNAIAMFDDGTGPALYAAGTFTTIEGSPVGRIVKWDGVGWSNLGSGLDGGVWSLVVFDDGTGPALYAAGDFTLAGGIPAGGIARWDGVEWSSLGSGVDGTKRGLAVFDDGSGPALYVVCRLPLSDEPAVDQIARWDGTSWDTLPDTGFLQDSSGGWSPFSPLVSAELPNRGQVLLFAGGVDVEGVRRIAVRAWDGRQWNPVGPPLPVSGTPPLRASLGVFDGPTGPVLWAGGQFSNNAAATNNVACLRLDQLERAVWAPPGNGLSGPVASMVTFDDGSGPSLYAGGSFTAASGLRADRIARWDGSEWASLGTGLNGSVRALTVYDDGTGQALYVGGSFTTAGGEPTSGIARWDGKAWTPLGVGVTGEVKALHVHDDGTGPALFVGGRFSAAGGAPANNIAKWDGKSWTPLGVGITSLTGGCNGSNYQPDFGVLAFATFDDGSGSALFVGGGFLTVGGSSSPYFAKWNGVSWSHPAGPGSNCQGPVRSLCVFGDRDGFSLIAGGRFWGLGSSAFGPIARWNGMSWSPVGPSGVFTGWLHVSALTVFDDGSGAALYVGGSFVSSVGGANLIRWDGSTWRGLGSGEGWNWNATGGGWQVVDAFAVFDDGNGPALFAGGSFTDSAPRNAFIAKWGCVNR